MAVEDFARFAAIFSIAEIIRAAADCGTESIIYTRIRSCDRPMPRFVKACFHLRTSVSAVVVVLAISILILNSNFQETDLLLLLVLIMSVQSSALIILQRHFSPRLLIALLALAALSVGVVFIMVIRADIGAYGSIGYVVLIIFPELAVTIASVFLVRRWLVKLMDEPARLMRSLWKVMPTLRKSAMGAVIVIAYTRLDAWIILPILGTIAQANYSAGMRFVDPANMLAGLAATAYISALGAIDRKWISAQSDLLAGTIKSIQILQFMTSQIVLGFGAYLTASALFGFSTDAAAVAGFLGFALPTKIVSMAHSGLLIRLNKMYDVLVASLLNFSCVVLMSLALAPFLGLMGVCVAVLFGEILGVIYQNRKLA